MNPPAVFTDRMWCTFVFYWCNVLFVFCLLYYNSLPSDVFIPNWRVISFLLLHIGVRLWKHLRERMHLPQQLHPLRSHLFSRIGGGGTEPAGPIFCTAYFAIRWNVFPSSCKKRRKKSHHDPPPRIVAFPCIDFWRVVYIHLLFYALDFKENGRGPIMLIGSCSVKRNQGLL